MTSNTFLNTNNISFQCSSFKNFSENSFKTVKQHSFKIIHCLIMRQLSKVHLWYILSTYLFCLILKKKEITSLNSWKSFFVSICFNYRYFICQQIMILFTKNRLIHWKGVKVELIIIGVIINLNCFVYLWHRLSKLVYYMQYTFDVWDYVIPI